MATAIEFNHVSKLYRLGLVSTGTFREDIKRWWITSVQKKEDPYLTIGETNDRGTKGESQFVWALRDIDFKVEQGDVVGIIGKNGAGKSTLLKLLSRITSPTTGDIRAKGRIASLLEVGTGFHPEMTGRENIFLNGAILGMTKEEIARKLDEIIDFSGCERYIDTPVKRYSSGMRVRLGFAVAAHLDPDILVVDEVLAVGDAEFQKKAIKKMQDVSRGGGRTVLFVSHNMANITALCHHGVLLEHGKIKACGDIDDIVNAYISIENADLTTRKRTWEINPEKEATITGLEISVDGKTHSQMIDIHDQIRVGIDYYLKEDMQNCSMSFSLFKDGIRLFMTKDVDMNPNIFLFRKRGHHHTEFLLPKSFKPGIYDTLVNIGIPGRNHGRIDTKENPIQFEINHVTSDSEHKIFTRPGLVKFDIAWDDSCL